MTLIKKVTKCFVLDGLLEIIPMVELLLRGWTLEFVYGFIVRSSPELVSIAALKQDVVDVFSMTSAKVTSNIDAQSHVLKVMIGGKSSLRQEPYKVFDFWWNRKFLNPGKLEMVEVISGVPLV